MKLTSEILNQSIRGSETENTVVPVTPYEAEIISRCIGLNGWEITTLSVIALEKGVSVSTIRDHYIKAMRKLSKTYPYLIIHRKQYL
jgi:DNA-directed RNA polymerase sigma subunit (sigma70/sigma32)